MLAGLDALVFDIQDAGVRSLTYITPHGLTRWRPRRSITSYYVSTY